MAVNVTTADGDTTFTFEVTAPNAKMNAILAAWAEYVWEHGFGLTETVDDEEVKIKFEDATSEQKMGAIDKRIKKLGRDEANTQESIKAQETADEEKVVHEEL